MKSFELSIDELRARPGTKWHRYGDTALPMWVADMDFRIAAPVQAAIERLVSHEAYGYGAHSFDRPLERAYAERMRSCYGWEVDPELVLPTTELIQAMYATLLVFSAPGEGAV
ncbi:MAG: amino acid aminotransferase, partial [Chloroflexi bacterium]|nr:amino acid aminotransferase [Chloroflexota bacterium]